MKLNLNTCSRYVRNASLALMATFCLSSGIATAQKAPDAKADLFGGYSYVYPNSTLTGTQPGGLTPLVTCLCAIPRGIGVSSTVHFSPWFGITGDFSGNWPPSEATLSQKISRSSFYSLAAGPKFTWHTRHFSPFGEVLVGGQRLMPEPFHSSTTFGVIAGGGIDIGISRHIAWRFVRADYLYSNHSFGINPSVASTDIRGIRLESGVVFLFGGRKAAPAAAPVALAPEKSTAAAFAPTPFVVPTPAAAAPVAAAPTVMCSAQPSNMNAGESSTITSIGHSSQGLPMTYSFVSSKGTLSGSGSSTMLMTAGVGAGFIDVTCNVVDSMGQTASANTRVTLAAVALSPKPTAYDLCSVSFARDTARPVRVDNEAKACLDDIALTMQHQSTAALMITGNAQPGETNRNQRASQRAANVKAYLVTEKHIAPSRISLYTGTKGTRSTTNVLVPAGADVSAGDRTAVK